MRLAPCLPLLLAAASAGAFAEGALAQETPASAPLPEIRPFLKEVRRHLRSDEALLSQYTFTEKLTEHRLDGKGQITKTKAEVYEVYPSFEPGQTYRKLVVRDGVPIPAAEQAEQDRKQTIAADKQVRKLASEGPNARQKRELERRRQEEAVTAQVFEVYNITIVDREMLDGRSTILMRFDPRPDANPTGKAGKILKKFRGRAWIDEADHQVARIECELIDTLSFGFGIVARLKPGARVYFERHKINDEIWLPALAHWRGSARFFLVKGVSIDAKSEYSDYRKFSVESSDSYSTQKSTD
ncbi:MAG TPA: hypothetical protein VJA66_16205 [Thermoanaerobaculia bacterium]